jgi:hypothetical protein
VTIDGSEHRAHLLDTSDAGARVHCRTALAVGQAITVCAPDVSREAVVRWVHPDGSGGLEYTANRRG